jgi:hypothetical protein
MPRSVEDAADDHWSHPVPPLRIMSCLQMSHSGGLAVGMLYRLSLPPYAVYIWRRGRDGERRDGEVGRCHVTGEEEGCRRRQRGEGQRYWIGAGAEVWIGAGSQHVTAMALCKQVGVGGHRWKVNEIEIKFGFGNLQWVTEIWWHITTNIRGNGH